MIMSHIENEILYINLEYKSKDLYESFVNLPLTLLENLPAQYINKDYNDDFDGKTISDLKKFLNTKGIETTPRTDLVAQPNTNDVTIKNIIDQLNELDLNTGLITFFEQKAGNDVPLHGDYPYRKNCLLMIPIFYNDYKPTSAVTYYKDGGSYNITRPVIMDVMKPHGVKGITSNRLMLHIELPDLPFEELAEKLNEKFEHRQYSRFKADITGTWSCESLIPDSFNG